MFVSNLEIDSNRNYFCQLLLVANCSLSFAFILPAKAQIIPDNSLGNEGSIVTPQDTFWNLIEGGAIRDNNLFHSFSEFNVDDGAKVDFANPNGIANILTRITGNNISEIFGTLGVDGGANLFLLNPNGIIFGENASLDVNGSFLATTAQSYVFENGFAYSASNPEIPPLLTINIPLGVQFGSQAEPILNQSFYSNELNEFVGLEVSSAQNLTFLGGDILFNGGIVTAPNGFIEIGSVAPNNFVSIIPTENNWTLDYTGVNSFQDVNLTQAASISSSGDGAGQINIQANNLNVLESSAIAANNFGSQDGGSLRINAQESVIVDGADANGFSSISTHIYDNGQGANLTIKTKTLQVTDGGYVSVNNYGTGEGGNLTIVASESIEITGVATDGSFPSALYASSDGEGNAGNLTIIGDSLIVKDGGKLDSGVVAEGNGGNVAINVDEIEIIGVSPDGLFPSALYIYSDAEGNAGNLTMIGNSLIVKDGGQLDSGVIDAGNGGNVIIEVDEIEIIGVSPDGSFPSALYVSSDGEGDAGNLAITGNSLIVQDGGQLDSGVVAEGNGGNVAINVDEIEIIGASPDGVYPSALYVSSDGEGDAGNLSITGNSLIVKDGGQLDSGVVAEGNGGNVAINVDEIEIIGASPDGVYPSALYVSSDGEGDAGNLSITGNSLIVQDGGQLDSGVVAEGNGGNVAINVDEIEITGVAPNGSLPSTLYVSSDGEGDAGNLVVIGNSLIVQDGGQINSETLEEGMAGDINITANNILVTDSSLNGDFVSKITATSDSFSPAGSINITAKRLDITNNGEIVVKNTDLGDAGNITITAQEINLDGGILNAEINQGKQGNINLKTQNIFLNNSQITARAFNDATGGNININNLENIVLFNQSQIIADAIAGDGGNIDITTQGFFISPDSLITASSQFGLDGNISIDNLNGNRFLELSPLPDNFIDGTKEIIASCNVGANKFAIAGNGGLPDNPGQYLRAQTVWQDLRILSDNQNQSSTSEYLRKPTIVEAQTWKINQQGKIELLANIPRGDLDFEQNNYKCSG